METVIQYQQRGNHDRNQRWDRLKRAKLFEQYVDLNAQGISQRQAAELLAPVYNWFTEGFDTADVQEAKVLLQEHAG